MENNIIVDNTDNSIIITDNDGDYRVVKFKLDIDTNTVKVKELCDVHFRNNLNYNDMTLLILELTKLRDQLIPEVEEEFNDDEDVNDDIIDPLKDFSSDLRTVLDYANKAGINPFQCRSESRVSMIATQTQQVVVLPISEERKKMAVKQQDNNDALLGLKDKK